MQQARDAMREMLGKLGQSHFAIIPSDLYEDIPPAHKDQSEADARNASTHPATVEEQRGVAIEAAVVDGKVRVVAVEDGSPAARAGVRMGWELITVDGVDLVREIAFLAGSGLHERELYERSLIEDALLGSPAQPAQAVFADGDGQIHKLTLGRIPPRGNLVRFGFLPQTRVWIEARRIDGPIEYIRFNAFLDPEHVMSAFEKAVRDCLKCDGFVIDLRGNPGGIGAMSMGMAGWFVSRRGNRLGRLQARDYQTDFEINPRADTFAGPLAILVDGASASTAEIFAAGLQDISRARVFGTQTAGAALPSVIIRLANSDGFQYAEANYASTKGRVLEGSGVTPDVSVKHTRESLLSGRDAALDAAVTWIKSKKQGDQ
jgi:carboxyl-terminal processing protease